MLRIHSLCNTKYPKNKFPTFQEEVQRPTSDNLVLHFILYLLTIVCQSPFVLQHSALVDQPLFIHWYTH